MVEPTELVKQIRMNFVTWALTMHFKRCFISFCLLFTYSLGFAHDLVPHSHHGDNIESTGEQHSHDHHQHQSHKHHSHDGGSDREHITHADHMDDGIMDYLICVLGEAHHGTTQNDRCFYTVAKAKDLLNIRTAMDTFTTLMFALHVDLDTNSQSGIFNPEVEVAYHSPPILRAPNRGPPSSSC